MKLDSYSMDNAAVSGDVQVDKSVFANKVNDHLIYEAIKAELANARQGTVKTKRRSEVRGSRRKLFRQKGSGRARPGTDSSPIRVGGGVIFGPQPRDYSIRLPKKIRRAAMVSLLSFKMRQGVVKIIDDFESTTGKTKEMHSKLVGLTKSRRLVIIASKLTDETKRALRNIPWVRAYDSSRLVYKDIFYAQEVMITRSALLDIESRYAGLVKGEVQ